MVPRVLTQLFFRIDNGLIGTWLGLRFRIRVRVRVSS